MTPEEWIAYQAAHKGITGSGHALPPSEEILLSKDSPVPYIVNFGDGSSLQVTFGDQGQINVTKPAKPVTVKAPPAPVTRTVGGSVYQWDGTKQAWTPAAGIPAGAAKQVPGRTVKGDDGTIYTVGADGQTLTEQVTGQNLGKQHADAATSNAAAATSNAATAAQRATETATNDTAKNKIAQQNADTNALRTTYQGQVAQAKQDYLDGKLSLAEFQAQVTELHQQATEALTARAQDLNAATTMARDQASADATWASTSVPAGGNQALVDVLNKEGAPVGINLPKAQPTPYPRPDINTMVANSLAKLGIAAPWSGSAGQVPSGPYTNTAAVTSATSTAAPTGFQVPTPASVTAAPAVSVGTNPGITPGAPGMPLPTPGPRFGVTGPS